MTVTIGDVRIRAQDTVEPYTYSDDLITSALAEAADWIIIRDVPVSCPKYDVLQKLVTVRTLKTAARSANPTTNYPVSQITEGNKTVSYAATAVADTLQYQIQQLTADIEDIVSYCKGKAAGKARGGIGMLYGNH